MARGFGYVRLVKVMLKRGGNSISVKQWLILYCMSDILSLTIVVRILLAIAISIVKIFSCVLASHENYSLEHFQ